MVSFEVLQILVFLIPGLISSALFSVFVVRGREQKDFERVVEALIYSLLIYVPYSLVRGTSPIILDRTEDLLTYSFEPVSFAILLALAVVLPMLMSFLVTNDLHMKAARWLHITTRTARSSVWFDVFCDQKRRVIIDFANGRQLYGWPMYYSDSPERPYLYIYQPYWIEDGKYIATGLHGILVTPEQNIDQIEFLADVRTSNKETADERQESRQRH